jgi:hypothetical protein
MRDDPTIRTVRARAYTVPNHAPEADGTYAWDRTTIVVVHIEAGGETGLGYSHTDASTASLIERTLASPAPRMVPRPRRHRADAVRRGAGAAGRRDRPSLMIQAVALHTADRIFATRRP